MQITQANLDALRVTFEKRFGEAYAAVQPALMPLATEVPSSTKANTYGWIAQQVQLRQWIGPRVAQNLSEHSYALANQTFEGTVELDREDLEDDNLGIFESQAIPQLAEAAAKHPDTQIASVLASNPLAFDGLALFHASHPDFNGGTYDNDHSLTLNATNIEAIKAIAAAYVGEDGQPLEVRYTHLIVPPQLEFTAKQILSSATYASLVSGEGSAVVQIENQLAGTLDVIVSPRLAGEATQWYIADLSKSIKPIVRQVRKAPEFVTRDSPTDPKVFDVRKFTYGVDLRDAHGVSLPFLIARSKP
jgi:phage major head subunit gpT-like protein